MSKFAIDYSNVLPFIALDEIVSMADKTEECRKVLLNKTGKGNDFVDWVKWPITISSGEVERIIACSERLKKLGKYLVVIGIGGSYLGAKAGLSMLRKYYENNEYQAIFAGNTFSADRTYELLEYLKDKDFSVVVISKSGTTTESAIAFRLFRQLLIEKYQDKYNERVVAITTNHDSALHDMALESGYEEFFIPDGIGGRYSVLTSVGLLPIAFEGYDIKKVLQGSIDAFNQFSEKTYMENEALLYAAIRNLLYQKGKNVEILGFYEPKMRYIGEWWKQLYGESEGKDGKGIYVASASFSTDLHSLGQMIQDGERNIFETVLQITTPVSEQVIPFDEANLDGLNFLAGKTMDYVNKQAFLGTLLAHVDGGVPNIVLEFPEISAFAYGYLAYFFEFACGVSAYTLGINPFNQPGVEAYKKNMFALLGKPGYEALAQELKAKLNK